jgi:hypothetical protein
MRGYNNTGDNMAMRSKLWSLNALASETGHNIRTIARALDGVPPDGEIGKHPAWTLKTALAALAQRDRAVSGGDAALDEIEAAGHEVEELLEHLRACHSHDEARRVLNGGAGGAVGRLDRALESGAASRKPAEQQLLKMVRDSVIGAVVGEILELAGWSVPA